MRHSDDNYGTLPSRTPSVEIEPLETRMLLSYGFVDVSAPAAHASDFVMGGHIFTRGHRQRSVSALYTLSREADGRVTLWRSDMDLQKSSPLMTLPKGAHIHSLMSTAGGLLFIADDLESGEELWFTPGTPSHADATPILLRDIRPGKGSSAPKVIAFNGRVAWFSADDGAHGRELWALNVQTRKLHLVEDINPGPASSNPTAVALRYEDSPMRLLFTADDGTHGRELWVSDESENVGAELLIDARPGPKSSGVQMLTLSPDPTEASRLAPLDFNAVTFFSADSPALGRELWLTDGTPQGTRLVKDISPGPSGSDPRYLGSKSAPTGGGPGIPAFKTVYYFAATDPEHGREMWKTDGSAEETVLAHDLNPGGADSSPQVFHADSGIHIFQAYTAIEGWQIHELDYASDQVALLTEAEGTDDPGVRWKKIAGLYVYQDQVWSEAGRIGSLSAAPVGATLLDITNAGNPASSEPRNLVATMRAPDGTGLLLDLKGNLLASFQRPIAFAAHVIGRGVVFAARTAPLGNEPWITDGTVRGTRLVRDINPGRASSNPRFVTDAGQMNIYPLFSADDGAHGRELWESDGSSRRTTLVSDLQPGGRGSNPDRWLYASTSYYLLAGEAEQRRLRMIAEPVAFGPNNGELLITGGDGNDRISLWRSENGKQIQVSVNGRRYTQPSRFITSIRLYGGRGDDIISVASPFSSLRIFGGDGDDLITGSTGKESIFGGAGNDTLRGNGGNDVLDGGSGRNSVAR